MAHETMCLTCANLVNTFVRESEPTHCEVCGARVVLQANAACTLDGPSARTLRERARLAGLHPAALASAPSEHERSVWPRRVALSLLGVLAAWVLLIVVNELFMDRRMFTYDTRGLIASAEVPEAPFSSFGELRRHVVSALGPNRRLMVLPSSGPRLSVWTDRWGHQDTQALLTALEESGVR